MQRRIFFALVATLFMSMSVHGQSADALYVVTYLDVKPASAAAGAALATQYVRDTKQDTGNVRVDAFREIGRNNRFVLIEAWKDQASFDGHEKAAHTAAFRDKLKAIHRSPYDQRINHGFSLDAMPAAAGPNAIYVVTHVDVPGPRREEAEVLLRNLSEPTRKDAGHVVFDVYQQVDPRTNHFNVFAVWNSRSAFDAYGTTPHWLQFREALAPMLGALYDERLYQRMSP